MLRTPAFYLMWIGYALGCSAGLMVISQLVPFARSVGIAAASLSTMTLVVGAFGNASGRILSGWMSDRLGRINVLRTMSYEDPAFMSIPPYKFFDLSLIQELKPELR